ncbi:DMT family transporter [Methylobacterium sp. E-066]|uniref:DMT family transporter n=1 Tax=Methylobacterium sp. E-066 TaxID=2836584 RepID=UPI001FBA544A|nr:DMT family transporter [Methylobacterium sp. E-066]MCJ2141171.1 DMT family transporter [Methylobacterium sp. E-066]
MGATASTITPAVAPTAYGLLLSTGFLLGLTTVMAGLASGLGWHPISFLFWSALGGGLVLATFAGLAGERLKPSSTLLRYGLQAGMLSFALPNILSFAAIPHVGAGFVALCLAFPPLLTYGLALILGMDRVSVQGVVGMGLGLGGAVLFAASRLTGAEGGGLWAGLALAAPVSVAAGNIYRTVAWPADTSPGLLAPVMVLTAAVMIGAYAILAAVPLFAVPATWTLALLPIQAAIIAATYGLFFVLQKVSGPVGLSQIGWIGAITGKGLAVALLGESFPPILALAIPLILAGIVLVSRRPR